jgi:hypothetical protein
MIWRTTCAALALAACGQATAPPAAPSPRPGALTAATVDASPAPAAPADAGLAPTAAAPIDDTPTRWPADLVARPLAGPFPSLAAACQAAVAVVTGPPDDPSADPAAAPSADPTAEPSPRERITCAAATRKVVTPARAHLAPPFTAITALVVSTRGGAVPLDFCTHALVTGGGYWLTADPAPCHGPAGDGHDLDGLDQLELTVTPMFAARQPVLRLRTALRERHLSLDQGPRGERVEATERHANQQLLLCAVGASGHPSCLAPIITSYADGSEPAVPITVTPTPDGLTITSPTPGDPAFEPWAAAVGVHHVTFP